MYADKRGFFLESHCTISETVRLELFTPEGRLLGTPCVLRFDTGFNGFQFGQNDLPAGMYVAVITGDRFGSAGYRLHIIR